MFLCLHPLIFKFSRCDSSVLVYRHLQASEGVQIILKLICSVSKTVPSSLQALVVLAVLAGRSADFFNKEVDEASAGGIADLLCNLGNRHA